MFSFQSRYAVTATVLSILKADHMPNWRERCLSIDSPTIPCLFRLIQIFFSISITFWPKKANYKDTPKTRLYFLRWWFPNIVSLRRTGKITKCSRHTCNRSCNENELFSSAVNEMYMCLFIRTYTTEKRW